MAAVARVGEPAPDFRLSDLDGRPHSPVEARGRLLVLSFWSSECPWSKRADELLVQYQEAWPVPVEVWWIASNANEGPEHLMPAAVERSLAVVLRDPDQEVADRYGAETTPHLYIVDTAGVLRYRGALDDVTFRHRQPERLYVWEAIEALVEGRLPNPAETTAYGCAIVRMAEA